jgi:hypothetical protein
MNFYESRIPEQQSPQSLSSALRPRQRCNRPADAGDVPVQSGNETPFLPTGRESAHS